MARFFGKVVEGFIGAVLLVALVFAWNVTRGSRPVLMNLLTPEKFPTFASEVAGVCAVAGILWAIIDVWTRKPNVAGK